MVPIFVQEGFVITFEAIPEQVSMRHHFIKECGWSESEYRKIKNSEWFCARVAAWKDGVEQAATYLGCCCYQSAKDFYTKYKNDYFADMVKEVVAIGIDSTQSSLSQQQ